MILAALALAQAQVEEVCAALETPNMTRNQILSAISCVNREAAQQMSRGLPSRVDELSTLIGVVAMGPRLIYSMRIEGLRADFSSEELERREGRVRTNVCDTPEMRAIIGFGGAYQYIWLDREGMRIHNFSIDSCPPARR